MSRTISWSRSFSWDILHLPSKVGVADPRRLERGHRLFGDLPVAAPSAALAVRTGKQAAPTPGDHGLQPDRPAVAGAVAALGQRLGGLVCGQKHSLSFRLPLL